MIVTADRHVPGVIFFFSKNLAGIEPGPIFAVLITDKLVSRDF